MPFGSLRWGLTLFDQGRIWKRQGGKKERREGKGAKKGKGSREHGEEAKSERMENLAEFHFLGEKRDKEDRLRKKGGERNQSEARRVGQFQNPSTQQKKKRPKKKTKNRAIFSRLSPWAKRRGKRNLEESSAVA